MANKDQLAMLLQGVTGWNTWRDENDSIRPDLISADLINADLSNANLSFADLSFADLTAATLTAADLSLATLQDCQLNAATLTGVLLWETQRAGWSIRGVTCEAASWDQGGEEIVYYAPGEFERLYSEQPRIELFYKDGLARFELNTLPALLQHLSALHPDATIRLKSIQETRGGTVVSITVQDADQDRVEAIRVTAEESQAAQVALRDHPAERTDIERRLLHLESLIPQMQEAIRNAGIHVNVMAPVQGPLLIAGRDAQQHVNDLSAIQPVLDEIASRRGELPLAADQGKQLERAIRDVQAELQKSQPKHPVISEGLTVVRDFAVGATSGAAGTALAASWEPLIRQLTQVVHRLAG